MKRKTKETKEQEQLDIVRARGIFKAALRGEIFGPHPGYADLKIKLFVYNPLTKRDEKLPGKEITLLVSSIEEVDQMIKVFEVALQNWIAGYFRS